MLLLKKKVQRIPSTHLKTRLRLTPDNGLVYICTPTVSKVQLDSGIQMLVKNEKTVISDTSDGRMTLANYGENNFLLTFTHPACLVSFGMTIRPSGLNFSDEQAHVGEHAGQQDTERIKAELLKIGFYIHKQMIPLYSQCVLMSSLMQNCFGKISGCSSPEKPLLYKKKIPDSFMLDNSIIISIVTDMLNENWNPKSKHAVNSGEVKTSNFYSFHYASTLLFLASIFCATAPPPDKSSLYHVSQARMTEMPSGMQDLMWNEIPAEKRNISLLMKGESAEQRVMRCNLAVRRVNAQHKFALECMPSVMGMNASGSFTDMMLVTGVHNRNVAVIYHNSDTIDKHSSQMAAFMTGYAGLSPVLISEKRSY